MEGLSFRPGRELRQKWKRIEKENKLCLEQGWMKKKMMEKEKLKYGRFRSFIKRTGKERWLRKGENNKTEEIQAKNE